MYNLVNRHESLSFFCSFIIILETNGERNLLILRSARWPLLSHTLRLFVCSFLPFLTKHKDVWDSRREEVNVQETNTSIRVIVCSFRGKARGWGDGEAQWWWRRQWRQDQDWCLRHGEEGERLDLRENQWFPGGIFELLVLCFLSLIQFFHYCWKPLQVSCSPMEQIHERLRAFGEFEVLLRNGVVPADYRLRSLLADYLFGFFIPNNNNIIIINTLFTMTDGMFFGHTI